MCWDIEKGASEMQERLDKIVQLLEMLQVSGYQNCAIVVACINECNALKEEVAAHGDADA